MYKFDKLDKKNKYYADVKYVDKDLAKSLGAKWDWNNKKWYFTKAKVRHNWDIAHSDYKSDEALLADNFLTGIELFDEIRKNQYPDALSVYISYDDLLSYLYNKYGPVRGDYFLEGYIPNFRKYSRTKEGIEVHHIDENKYLYLSNPEWCEKQNVPFECQKADRLIYCNKIEHLLLHIRIAEEFHADELHKFYSYGIKTLISKINDYFEYDELPDDWNHEMIIAIQGHFYDYVLLLYQIVFNLNFHKFSQNEIASIVFSSYSGKECTKIFNAFKEIQEALEEISKS